MGNGLKRLSKADQDLVLAIAQKLNDRDALAARVGGEAVMRSLPLRMILGEHAGDDDDDALWHRVFSAERDRVLRANARGARLVSHLSATTNGRRASFVYLDLNLLNKPSSSADICARGSCGVRCTTFDLTSRGCRAICSKRSLTQRPT
jgi:hypothetical protein